MKTTEEPEAELAQKIETLMRCGVHHIQIPDVDLEFTSKNIAIWILQNYIDREATHFDEMVEKLKAATYLLGDYKLRGEIVELLAKLEGEK